MTSLRSEFREWRALTPVPLLALLLSAVLGVTAGEERTGPFDEGSEIYIMPPLEVGAKATEPILDPRRKWLHGSLGTIHVLSTLSLTHTKRALRDLAVFRDFAGQFGREFSPRANSEAWIVLASDADHIRFFARDHEKKRYNTLAAGTVFVFAHFESGPMEVLERTIRRGWMSAIYHADFPDGPLWLRWATARILGDMDLRGDRVNFGALLGDRQFFLENLTPVPLGDLFAIKETLTPSLSQYSSGIKRFIATRQAAAFMHFCLFGSKGRYAAAFEKIRERARYEIVSERDFMAAFGMSFAQMEKLLHNYTNAPGARFETHRYRIEGADERNMTIAPCSPEELDGFERRYRDSSGNLIPDTDKNPRLEKAPAAPGLPQP